MFLGICVLLLEWKSNAQAFVLWLIITTLIVFFLFVGFIWQKFVSLKISYILGSALWALAFWIAWHSVK
jgi:heme/copper-type cytochrome/quinol oxidase subunit 4